MHKINIYHEKVSHLSEVVTELLILAQQERWDELLLEWPRYELATSDLPMITWSILSTDEQRLLEMQLRQLDSVHSSFLQLTSNWRDELKDILQNSIQSRKLNDHYR
ncbi:flagellar protein FliT [Deefgea tanakiae]|uniref:Flagellar protein FliT n=1 Tax=Deefgea tanakiae TaxID=2865840 RepID=A0ABX8Z9F6_9NEIS|nr:flagellar protein FliT [Deefgea tanakiae]QZA79198.1 flagellar protein FliT [Deefgea tanakiae]